jgi:hypothetical protein
MTLLCKRLALGGVLLGVFVGGCSEKDPGPRIVNTGSAKQPFRLPSKTEGASPTVNKNVPLPGK